MFSKNPNLTFVSFLYPPICKLKTLTIIYTEFIQILIYYKVIIPNKPDLPKANSKRGNFNHEIIFHYDFIIEMRIYNETEFFLCSLHRINRKGGNQCL
jgi:hypothetical protein